MSETPRDPAAGRSDAQGAGSADPFGALGLPQRFEIADEEIDRAWRAAASRCHPDRFIDPVAREQAAREAARLNAARAVLRDPLERAEALLGLQGIRWGGSGAGSAPAFLLEMLELRQELAAQAEAGDLAGCRRLAAAAEGAVAERLAAVSELLAGEISGEGLERVREQLGACRYLRRFSEEARLAGRR
jgi:DnaJ-domain-containing protein 1